MPGQAGTESPEGAGPGGRVGRGPHLLRGLVEGHGRVHQLQPVFHLEHELLPVRGNLLSAVPDHVHVVVIGLQHGLGLLLDLQGALVCLLKGRGERRLSVGGLGGGSRHTLTGKAAASSGLLAFMETTPVNTTSLGHLEKHGRQVSERKSLCRPTTVCVCPMKDEINALGIFQHGSWLWGFQLFRNSRKNP